MEEIIIDKATQEQRLDKFLKRYLPNASSGFLYKMLRKKKIKVNGRKSEGGYILKEGDSISIYLSDETLLTLKGAESSFEECGKIDPSEAEDFRRQIIFEDADVLIFNKPAGMLSQRADDRRMSACEYLVGYLWHTGFLNADSIRKYRPSAVNRLDRNTSGLLVCAKSFAAARQLSELIRERELRKHYLALVYGEIRNSAELCAYLKKDINSNKVDILRAPREGYEEIRTGIRPIAGCENMTLLDVELITGKPHQIRAHLSSMGHPIIGDRKYSTRESLRAAAGSAVSLKRQFLHAYKLVFPACEGSLANISCKSFLAPLPEDLDAFLERNIHVTNFRG